MTNNKRQNNSSAPLQNIQVGRLTLLWLLVGFILLPFTTIRTMLPLAVGADAFVSKSASPEKLRKALAEAIERKS